MAGVALNHGGFVSRIGRGIRRVNAEHVTLRLQGASELGGPHFELAGHDDHLDLGIGEQVFDVVEAEAARRRVLPHAPEQRKRPPAGAGSDKRQGGRPDHRDDRQARKTHELVLWLGGGMSTDGAPQPAKRGLCRSHSWASRATAFEHRPQTCKNGMPGGAFADGLSAQIRSGRTPPRQYPLSGSAPAPTPAILRPQPILSSYCLLYSVYCLLLLV